MVYSARSAIGSYLGLAGVGSLLLDGLDDLHACVEQFSRRNAAAMRTERTLNNLAEDDVLAIEPRGDNGGDEELGSVGVGSGVGGREESGLGVLELEAERERRESALQPERKVKDRTSRRRTWRRLGSKAAVNSPIVFAQKANTHR